jgi:ABC-2 type transport system permease protein
MLSLLPCHYPLHFTPSLEYQSSALMPIGFVLCAVVCFVLLLAGFPAVLDFLRGWAPQGVVEGLASTSASTHYESMMRGVIDLRDVFYFITVIAAFLILNCFAIDWKKSD